MASSTKHSDGETINVTQTTQSIAQLASCRPSTLGVQRGERLGVIEEVGVCEVRDGGLTE